MIRQYKHKELQELVRTSYFVPEIHSDIPGVELCAALKNVLALGVGMFEGMKSGDNTKAFFLIKSLQELVVLLESFGGKKETVYGLAGIGDLVMTAFGALGRNRNFGKKIGEGIDPKILLTQLQPEGVTTVVALYQLLQARGLELPIFQALYQIIYENKQVGYLKDLLKNY